ncbi:MAG: molybdenum cofactor biosynthesis protein MoaE [Alphaproteobacteria bacterium]|nr:molybdenum cofactor biosynthesis protein MoaE [Alphaproteobacteria bacterium]
MAFDPTVRIQQDDFDIKSEIEALTAGQGNTGAVVTFSGLCRDEDGTLSALELEHYPGMAESEIRRIAVEAADRWPLGGVTVIHRVGKIRPGENIVLVAATSKHRQAAFDGAHFIMDFLKSDAPFWKREIARDGRSGSWVDAKDRDNDALKRWR